MSEHRISAGKYRALQKASTSDGLFTILAIDHQDALRRALNRQDPNRVSDADLIAFKQQIDTVSGVLLDPLYGAFQAIAAGTLGAKGLLVELEKADYQMHPMPLDVEIDPQWSVAKIRQMNADGVKLFFYYNPAYTDHARRQEAVVRAVAAECERLEIPFYAEPIIFHEASHPPDEMQFPVVEAARQIGALHVDVLKLEFPVDSNTESDPAVWMKACQAVTEAVTVPWVLLSAGVSFEVFTRQLEIACKAGASGFIVGRALWGEATSIQDPDARQNWLEQVGRRRMELLSAIAAAYGTSWHDYYRPLLPAITPETFRQYPGTGAPHHD
jgi:tagatose 1,6-diphosphate aldolase